RRNQPVAIIRLLLLIFSKVFANIFANELFTTINDKVVKAGYHENRMFTYIRTDFVMVMLPMMQMY
ncbi:hypothetical protein ACFLU9_03005, partial [Chloroflexota bacterium]